MTKKAPTPCRHVGCRALVDVPGYCERHQSEATGWASPRWSGSRHERGYGSRWVKIRERIMKRDNGLCQQCLRARKVTRAEHVDHIVSKASGGTDTDSNLEALCGPCHRAKTARERRRPAVAPTLGAGRFSGGEPGRD
ncbi:HNH endonuclease [Burkholderia vietnamiensis]|uniref:HNH endonuclease n=1 Tax=Burkholderia vietnamiensis TaxID=60552 RepID=UPI001593DD10|nr:HNH endonuclease [Burkholderia vietnamiensis]MDN7816731.1 HNH endonuclease [Burkholderia vietnamiensis]HDR9100695.1 HNH endonuclease [Burkholderia vietnamiensis]